MLLNWSAGARKPWRAHRWARWCRARARGTAPRRGTRSRSASGGPSWSGSADCSRVPPDAPGDRKERPSAGWSSPRTRWYRLLPTRNGTGTCWSRCYTLLGILLELRVKYIVFTTGNIVVRAKRKSICSEPFFRGCFEYWARQECCDCE